MNDTVSQSSGPASDAYRSGRQPFGFGKQFWHAIAVLGILLGAAAARGASISVSSPAYYVGDFFIIQYGLGSPSPSKTAYVYINGECVDSATNSSNATCYYYPPSSGDYTIDVYYTDSVNGPFDPTYANTAGTYYVPDPSPPTVTGGSAQGIVGVSFNYSIQADSSPTGYDASSLPPGLSVNTGNGIISGTPTTAGTYHATIYASNSGGSGSAALTITIVPQSPASIAAQPASQSPVPVRSIAANADSFAVRQDGVVFGWGANSYSTLGDGTTTSRGTPAPPTGLSNIVAVAPGANHTLALGADGRVWAFGWNYYGQLGDGTTTQHATAIAVPGLSNVKAIAAGWAHSIALKSDGTVWVWGYNGYNQLGDGTTTDRHSPVQVTGLTNVIAIASGAYHSLALKSDGSVWAWGFNAYGQLGDGSTTSRYTPVQISGLSPAVAVMAGVYNSGVIKADHTVFECGYNASGQLGDGTTSQRNSPVQAAGVSNVVWASMSGYHTVAVKSDGTVWTWGNNNHGQLGDGTTTQRNTAVQMSAISSASSAAAGGSYTLVLRNDGTIWACGINSSGELGDGTYTQRTSVVQTVRMGDAVFTVTAAGAPAPTYQWQRQPAGQTGFTNLANNSTYSGVTTATLQVANPTSVMSGDQFRCVVTNTSGSATSNAATLVVSAPVITKLSGDNQSVAPSTFNPQAFDVAIWNGAGSLPLMGAPVTFSVQSGGGFLATTNVGTPTLFQSITVASDLDGTAQVYYQQPSSGGITSQITASSDGVQVVFATQSATPMPPPNAPPWVRASTSTPTSVSFSWGAATPGSGGGAIARYYLYRNGTQLNSMPQLSTSYTDTGVTAGTAYTYTVKAVDGSGNLSSAITLNVSAPASSTSGTFDVFTPTP